MNGPPHTALVQRIEAASRRPENLGQASPGVISLAVGEPGEDTPSRIVDAAIEALRAGRTRYSPDAGIPELRRALARNLTDTIGTDVDEGQVLLTHGAAAGLAATFLALLNPGDTVVLPEPTYSLYTDHTAMAGARHHWVPLTPSGHLDVPAIEAAVEQTRARLLVLCNPGNPTGAVFTRAELEAVAKVLERYPQLRLVCDEAYADIILSSSGFWSALHLREVAERVVVVRTFSKTYAMTGWRLGYVVATPHLIDAIGLIHRTFAGSINTAVQDAALAALNPDPDWHETQITGYRRRRDLVRQFLSDVPGVQYEPTEGAFYAFVRIDSPLSSGELTAYLAEAGVQVRSGDCPINGGFRGWSDTPGSVPGRED